MIRSIDTIQSNLNILQKKQENISANVANTNTFGYKAQQIIQSTTPAQAMFNFTNGPELNQLNQVGDFIFANQIDSVSLDQSQGGVKGTSRETDFSILGTGFFNVRLADGQTGYTRNGNFALNQDNQLTTQEGYLVLNQNNQPIRAEELTQQPVFKLTQFDNPEELVSRGQTLFTGATAGRDATDSLVQNKSLEASTVEMADEMVNLIETAREFESNQKLLHAADETLRKAVNEIGKA